MKKDFEEIYTEVYDECINNLKEVRNKLGKFVSGILLVLVVINVIVGIVAEYKSLLTISISLSVLVLLVFLKNAHKIYSQKYKEFVIGSLVKKYNQGLSFDSKSGLAVIDYRMSNFDNTFKEYYGTITIYKGGRFHISSNCDGIKDYYNGNKLVLVNKTPTARDGVADLIVQGPIGEIFGQL